MSKESGNKRSSAETEEKPKKDDPVSTTATSDDYQDECSVYNGTIRVTLKDKNGNVSTKLELIPKKETRYWMSSEGDLDSWEETTYKVKRL